MRALVTGASGFIGTALVNRLAQRGDSVVCQSRSSHEDHHGIKWIQHDLLRDSWESFPLHGIDVVFHLAGQTSTYSAKRDPIADLKDNAMGFLHLLEHVRKQEIPPFVVLAGTVTEVGVTEALPIHENMPDRPVTFYDISKLAAELYLKQYIREGWMKGCCLRLSNVYGRSQAGQKEDRGVLDKVFTQASSGRNITVFGDGTFLRDYIFIEDVISALIMASQHSEKTNGHNYCIGSGQGTSLKDAFLKVITIAARATGKPVALEHVNAPAGLSEIEYRNAVIDTSAFREATGWAPQYTFDTGLEAAYGASA